MRWLWVLALLGCDDGGSGPVALDQEVRQIGRLDMLMRDAAPPVVDATPVDAAPVDAAPRDMLRPDLGPPCMPVGDRQCRIDGGDEVFVCTQEGGFDLERCPPDTVCEGGDCVDPLVGCAIGERSCLAADTPSRCEPDADDPDLGRWVPTGEQCDAGMVCASGHCLTPACAAATVTQSYVGCDYWALDMQSFRYASAGFESIIGAPLGLLIFNPDTENVAIADVLGPDGEPGALVASYQMEPPTDDELPPRAYAARRIRSDLTAADGTVVFGGIERGEALEIPPGGRARILIPRTGFFEQSSHLRRLAWRLKTNSPVVAYQFNPLCCNYSFSNDASLLIPSTALGRRYRALTTPTQGGFLGGIAIIGTEPDTQVIVTMPGKRIAADLTNTVRVIDDAVQVTLQPHETLVLQGRNGPFPPRERDLSGALVQASAPVAVFAGHQCAQYPANLNACDHLEEQLIPTQAWGRQFALVPLLTRGRRGVRQPTEVNYYKFMADSAPTRIELSVPYADLEPVHGGQPGVTDCVDLLDGDRAFTLGVGEYCEFGTLHGFQALADQPILVRGVISGQDSTGEQAAYGARAGDPAAYLVAPNRQFRNDYPFYVPDTYARSAVTITAFADAGIELDGEPVDFSDAEPVQGGQRVFVHVPLGPGSHRLRGNRTFGIVVYGYDDFVAFAFSGGLNLEKE